MGLAGAERLFELMDETPEVDNGYVTLVNAKVDADGTITECAEHTGTWAWKHPHEDGTLTYTLLQGDVRLTEVDFAYEEGKPVLHDVSVYAEPGQKVAFVGATGAGKTTITNLINRFYDIADGKVRYDGININKIKKADLRRSLGIVLQETNLFTGTVMDNIRYGNLEATDDQCRQAAKLAGADDFITRLPQGYDALLQNKPPYAPPYIHKTEKGQRVSFQTWTWDNDCYTLTQYILDDEDTLQAHKFTCTYRATRREEMTNLLLAGGCSRVQWLFPEETGFYQPIVIAVK